MIETIDVREIHAHTAFPYTTDDDSLKKGTHVHATKAEENRMCSHVPQNDITLRLLLILSNL